MAGGISRTFALLEWLRAGPAFKETDARHSSLTSDDYGRCKQGRAGGADTVCDMLSGGCGARRLDRGIRQASWRRRHRSHAFGDGYKVSGWRKGAGFLGQAAPEASGMDSRTERPFKIVSPGGDR